MKKIYIWKANQALVSTSWNLYLNEDWVVEVEEWSIEEQIVQSYKLRNLNDLAEKYLEKETKKAKEK